MWGAIQGLLDDSHAPSQMLHLLLQFPPSACQHRELLQPQTHVCRFAMKLKGNTSHACYFKLLLTDEVVQRSLRICMQIKLWASDDAWSVTCAGEWLNEGLQVCIYPARSMTAQTGRKPDESCLDVSESNAALMVAAAASAWLMLCSTSLTFSCKTHGITGSPTFQNVEGGSYVTF